MPRGTAERMSLIGANFSEKCFTRSWIALAFVALVLLAGCGTTAARQATDQMLASDAVDHAVSYIDFSPLAGQKVFFDTKYMDQPPGINNGIGVVNQAYIASALRQHMLAAGVMLADKAENADIIVEARIGILGADRHDLTYGLPASGANNVASTAATAATSLPIVIPEVSLARKVDQTAAAKIACYAYARDTRERIWQSGTSLAKSSSKDTWILGAGPFQKSSVQNGVRFAGGSLSPFGKSLEKEAVNAEFEESMVFKKGHKVEPKPAGEIQQASAEAKAPADAKPAAAKDSKDAKPSTPEVKKDAPVEVKKDEPAEAPKSAETKTAAAPKEVTEPKPVTETPALQPIDRPLKEVPRPFPGRSEGTSEAATSPTSEAPASGSSFPWRRGES